jgi:hypothetical protein|nr:MAG TPA: hypothetical protein [Caudoviricetes sp.]
MKFDKSTNQKISLAMGILSFFAAFVLFQGDTWGFSPLAKQIFSSITGTISLVNMYFLGSTAEKIKNERNEK